ncbi:unnamed protein product [Prorocentrum cordatum]|uniref:Uncharacterized protein n=1 Tax=Prorocentrum cordatum TaxID=2364126 RepID=A0ABN9VUR3_9DINO|nr:unnamed protein product [Polarella glacialis]
MALPARPWHHIVFNKAPRGIIDQAGAAQFSAQGRAADRGVEKIENKRRLPKDNTAFQRNPTTVPAWRPTSRDDATPAEMGVRQQKEARKLGKRWSMTCFLDPSGWGYVRRPDVGAGEQSTGWAQRPAMQDCLEKPPQLSDSTGDMEVEMLDGWGPLEDIGSAEIDGLRFVAATRSQRWELRDRPPFQAPRETASPRSGPGPAAAKCQCAARRRAVGPMGRTLGGGRLRGLTNCAGLGEAAEQAGGPLCKGVEVLPRPPGGGRGSVKVKVTVTARTAGGSARCQACSGGRAQLGGLAQEQADAAPRLPGRGRRGGGGGARGLRDRVRLGVGGVPAGQRGLSARAADGCSAPAASNAEGGSPCKSPASDGWVQEKEGNEDGQRQNRIFLSMDGRWTFERWQGNAAPLPPPPPPPGCSRSTLGCAAGVALGQASTRFRHFLEAAARLSPVCFRRERGLESQVLRLLTEHVAPLASRPEPSDCVFAFLVEEEFQAVLGEFGPALRGVFRGASRQADLHEGADEEACSRPKDFGAVRRQFHVGARLDQTVRLKDVLRLLADNGMLLPMLCSSAPLGDGTSERVLPEPAAAEDHDGLAPVEALAPTPPVETLLKAELEATDPAASGGERGAKSRSATSGGEESSLQEQLLEAAAAAGAQEAAEPSPPPTLEQDPTMASCDFSLTAVEVRPAAGGHVARVRRRPPLAIAGPRLPASRGLRGGGAGAGARILGRGADLPRVPAPPDQGGRLRLAQQFRALRGRARLEVRVLHAARLPPQPAGPVRVSAPAEGAGRGGRGRGLRAGGPRGRRGAAGRAAERAGAAGRRGEGGQEEGRQRRRQEKGQGRRQGEEQGHQGRKAGRRRAPGGGPRGGARRAGGAPRGCRRSGARRMTHWLGFDGPVPGPLPEGEPAAPAPAPRRWPAAYADAVCQW